MKSGITKHSMLVTLSIGKWSGQRYDRNVSDEVARIHNSDSTMGRFQKNLVPKDVIKSIQKVENKARKFHRENTLPWGDGGVRMLPVKNFMDYSAGMRELYREFHEVVENFINEYERYVDISKQLLNGMFNPNDYPNKEELKYKFHFSYTFDSVPDSGDFRVEIPEEEADKIKSEISNRVENRIMEGMKDIWNRMYEGVNRVVDTLPKYNPAGKGTEKGSFKSSLIDNIVELCEVLPKLNVTDDPNLELIRKEVEEKLTVFSAEQLREDNKAREVVTESAEDIMNKMAAFMA